jgi:hypothetical protein
LLVQCTLFAVHTHADAFTHTNAACAAAGLIDQSAPSKLDCGKTTAADTCGVCQTLHHARANLVSALAQPAEFGFTFVGFAPAARPVRLASPGDFKHPVRAPPHLV